MLAPEQVRRGWNVYGDTDVIRRLAGQMREQGEELRLECRTLLASVEGVQWNGKAAEAMRAHMKDTAASLAKTAREHDEAADALVAHAAEVDRLKALIAEIEHRAMGLIAGAESRLRSLASQAVDLVKAAPSGVDAMLASFVPPPSGTKAWLDVDLPGLP